MKDAIIYLVVGLGALFLQTTVFSHFPVRPDLVLVLVVCLGLSQMTFAGVLIAFFLGCLMDVFAGSTPGFFALTKTMIFLLVYTTRGGLFFESHLARAGLVAVAVLLEAFVVLLLLRFTSFPPTFPSSAGRLIVGPLALTTVIAPFCFILLRRTRILV